MENWMEKVIWSIVHLMVNHANVLELEEFNNRHNIDCFIKEYKKVTHNIPSAFIQIVKNRLRTTGNTQSAQN